MPRVTHFELPADQTDRAQRFYAEVFDWSFERWDGPMPYWLVQTGNPESPGIDGGLAPRQQPGAGPTLVIHVDSVDEHVARVEKGGGTIVVPKMAIPGVGWCAYFVDPEQNTLGVFEPDESAA